MLMFKLQYTTELEVKDKARKSAINLNIKLNTIEILKNRRKHFNSLKFFADVNKINHFGNFLFSNLI